MENFILFLIIAVIAFINWVRNYQKEKQKHQDRVLTQQRQSPKPNIEVTPPFSKKKLGGATQYNAEPVSLETIPEEVVNVDFFDRNFAKANEGTNFDYNKIDPSQQEVAYQEYEWNKEEEKNLAIVDFSDSDAVKKAFVYSLIFDRKY